MKKVIFLAAFFIFCSTEIFCTSQKDINTIIKTLYQEHIIGTDLATIEYVKEYKNELITTLKRRIAANDIILKESTTDVYNKLKMFGVYAVLAHFIRHIIKTHASLFKEPSGFISFWALGMGDTFFFYKLNTAYSIKQDSEAQLNQDKELLAKIESV